MHVSNTSQTTLQTIALQASSLEVSLAEHHLRMNKENAKELLSLLKNRLKTVNQPNQKVTVKSIFIGEAEATEVAAVICVKANENALSFLFGDQQISESDLIEILDGYWVKGYTFALLGSGLPILIN